MTVATLPPGLQAALDHAGLTQPVPPAGAAGAQGPGVDPTTVGLMKLFDVNGDHSISKAEFTHMVHPPAAAGQAQVVIVFDHLDANHDGSLSAREIHAAVKAADHNGDGHLSLTEAMHNPITLVGVNHLLHHDMG
jgi:hypothetical protein